MTSHLFLQETTVNHLDTHRSQRLDVISVTHYRGTLPRDKSREVADPDNCVARSYEGFRQLPVVQPFVPAVSTVIKRIIDIKTIYIKTVPTHERLVKVGAKEKPGQYTLPGGLTDLRQGCNIIIAYRPHLFK